MRNPLRRRKNHLDLTAPAVKPKPEVDREALLAVYAPGSTAHRNLTSGGLTFSGKASAERADPTTR